MARITFYSGGKLRGLEVFPFPIGEDAAELEPAAYSPMGPARAGGIAAMAVQTAHVAEPRSPGVVESSTLVARSESDETIILPTTSLIVEGGGKAEIDKLQAKFGLKVIDEAPGGGVLLQADEGGEAGVMKAAEAALWAFRDGNVRAAHPNFIRITAGVRPSAATGRPGWNHFNNGNPGVPGADVAARAAWMLTKGRDEIRVAVLDDGVDVNHPALAAAVAASKDFVDGNATASPEGNDAHGTACAGIIFSRANRAPGIAPDCGLVAVRIAKSVEISLDGRVETLWNYDDFRTRKAIDWAWREGKADVLSNSWSGGPPTDAVTLAFRRARTRGRGGKGCVIAIAAGNSDNEVQFPATLSGVMAVGASNPWDQRKSRTSNDGEEWWGSCFGRELYLLAPGVDIATTVTRGAAGYGTSEVTMDFNGTSAATPHVAAAAALVLSLRPDLTEARVRKILGASADRLAANGRRNHDVGRGRLNIFAALRLARRS